MRLVEYVLRTQNKKKAQCLYTRKRHKGKHMNSKFVAKEGKKGFLRMDAKGQIGLPQVLALVILLFVVFTVGRILLNNTALDPDSSDGGIAVANPLTNIGLITMTGIVLIAAMASIVIRFF